MAPCIHWKKTEQAGYIQNRDSTLRRVLSQQRHPRCRTQYADDAGRPALLQYLELNEARDAQSDQSSVTNVRGLMVREKLHTYIRHRDKPSILTLREACVALFYRGPYTSTEPVESASRVHLVSLSFIKGERKFPNIVFRRLIVLLLEWRRIPYI